MRLYKVITQESNESPQEEQMVAAYELFIVAQRYPEAIKITRIYNYINVIS